jgi:polyhydroxyalkanoate synthesis repressor PhaR
MENPVILKKYANRRLYDTEQSAYVTLSQVAQLIKEGREVAILDAKTEEDVTAFILTQIILEEAKQNHTLLPVALLHLIIRHGDNLLANFSRNICSRSLKISSPTKRPLTASFSNGSNWVSK